MITPLYRAVEHDHMGAVKLLIEHGADYVDIHKAVNWRTDMAILDYLVDHGCDFNGMYDLSDDMALHRAIRNDSYYVCRLLVSNGADIEARNYDGNTPLLEVIASMPCGYYEMLDLLISRGADINVTNTKTGNTLLHNAMYLEYYADIVRLLLRNGIDPWIKNKDGMTAIDIAINDIEDDRSNVYIGMIMRAMRPTIIPR